MDDDDIALILEEEELSFYKEVQAFVNKLESNATMELEVKLFIDNKTWKLVELPSE